MKVLTVDMQNDFVSPGGVHHQGQSSVDFTKNTLFPFCRAQKVPICSIISDYRTAGGDQDDRTCVPGQWGCRSVVPADLVTAEPWVKASISPVWVREGGGDADALPGVPRCDPEGFSRWLHTTLGPPSDDIPVVIVGLVLEVCVLATLIELRLRGYPAHILIEGTDTYDGDPTGKQQFLHTLSRASGEHRCPGTSFGLRQPR